MTKPNILLVMCDQMTAALTGLYGHPVVRTPNLDRLAARGVRFGAAYSPCPLCAPARQCMMSGKYTSSNSCYDNAGCLHADEACIPHYLTNAGYDTVLSGKMHFVGPDQLHGYRARLVRNIYPADFSWTPEREYSGKLFSEMCIPSSSWHHAAQYTGKGLVVDKWHHSLSFDEETHFRAIQYLCARGQLLADRGSAAADPFFLTVSYHAPHEPFHAPAEFWDLYEGVDIPIPQFPEGFEQSMSKMDQWICEFHGCERENLRNLEGLRTLHRHYYGLVSYLDSKVGQLVACLERRGLAENTIIVFTSDHGDMLNSRGMVQKRTFYDWASRVPLLFVFPDGRHAGKTLQAPVNLVDLLATITELAGVDPSELARHDGRSLMPLIEGADDPERTTFSEMHTDGVYAPCFMVRKGRYKYVYVHGCDSQLFDLQDDPDEWHDLAQDPAYADVVTEMKQALLAQFDPDAIQKEIRDNIQRRRLIQRAMLRNGTSWNVQPDFGRNRTCASQYVRDDV